MTNLSQLYVFVFGYPCRNATTHSAHANMGQEHTHDQKSVSDSSFLFPPFSLLPYRGSFYPVSNPSGLHAHTRIHTHTEPTSPSMGLSTGLQSRPHSFCLELQKLHTGPHIPASEMNTATITT